MDTAKGVDESLAIRDLFNEWHARDTSKKVKAIKMASAQRGERIGTHPPYGYKKDSENPKRIVPNEDTAPVVQHIFALCASGLGPSKIARILREEQVLTLPAYILKCKNEAAFSPCEENPMRVWKRPSLKFQSMRNISVLW